MSKSSFGKHPGISSSALTLGHSLSRPLFVSTIIGIVKPGFLFLYMGIKTRIKICNSTNSILFGFIYLLQVYFTEGDHLHRPIPWETPKSLHRFTIVTGLPFHYQTAQLNKNKLTFLGCNVKIRI